MPLGKKFVDLTVSTDIDSLLGAAENSDGITPGNKFIYSKTLNKATPSDAIVPTEGAVIDYSVDNTLTQNHIYIGDATNKAAPSVYTTIDESVDDQILIETSKGTGVQLKVTGDSTINQDVSTTADTIHAALKLTDLNVAGGIVQTDVDGNLSSSTTLPADSTLYPITQVLYLDVNRVDTYTPDGSINKPFKTYSAMVAAMTSVVAQGYELHIAPGAYTEAALVTMPNVPLTIYGNEAVITFAAGVIFQNPYYTINDLNIVGNFTMSSTSAAGHAISQGGSITGNVTMLGSNGNFRSTSLLSGLVTITAPATTAFNVCTITSQFTGNGIIILENILQNATKSTPLITSLTGGTLFAINCLITNLGTGGCISCDNGADGITRINAIGTSIITAVSGNAINCGTSATATTKNNVSGTIAGVGYFGANFDVIGNGTVMGLGSDAAYDMYYRSAAALLTRIAPNTSVTKKYLAMTGTGAAGAIPVWDEVASELTADELAAIQGAANPSASNVFITQNDINKFDYVNALVVNRFGNDLAEMNYPSGSGAGFIAVAADFPATFVQGDCYMIPNGVTVTDNDPTKTNTGLTFTGPIQIEADATNSTWVQRDGKSVATALCTIGAAIYINMFATAPYPLIWCLDSETYYFPTTTSCYSSIFAPGATAQITGWYYLLRDTVQYFNNVQVTADGGNGGVMLLNTTSNAEFHCKKAFTTDATLSTGLFSNSSAMSNNLLSVYAGDIITTSSSQVVLRAQGSAGVASRLSAVVNGKIKGNALVHNSGTNLITIYALDRTDLTITETSGSVVIAASLDDIPASELTADELAAIQGANTPSAANVFATMNDAVVERVTVVNDFVTPTVGTDGFYTSSDYVGAYAFLASMATGNDGTYHGLGIYGRYHAYDGDGNLRVEINTLSGSDTIVLSDDTDPQVTIGTMSTIVGSDWYCKNAYKIDGGFKDANVSTAINLGDGSNTSFNTTNKTIVGAVNELGINKGGAKLQVYVASTGDTVLSGAQTLDGILVPNGQRVLVKDNIDQTTNGIYICNTSGAWTRATDSNTGPLLHGAIIGIGLGTLFGGTILYNSNSTAITIGVTNITYAKLNDWFASTITNDSSVSGLKVSNALDTIYANLFVDATKVVYVSALSGNDTNSGLKPAMPKATIQAAWNVAKTMTPTSTDRVLIYCSDPSYFYSSSDSLLYPDTRYIDIYAPFAIPWSAALNKPTINFANANTYLVDNIFYFNEVIATNAAQAIYFDMGTPTKANSKLTLYCNRLYGATYPALQFYSNTGGLTLYGNVNLMDSSGTYDFSDNFGLIDYHFTIGNIGSCQFFGTPTGSFNVPTTTTLTSRPTSLAINNCNYWITTTASYTGPWASNQNGTIYLTKNGNMVTATFVGVSANANTVTPTMIGLASGTIPVGFRPVVDMWKAGFGCITTNSTVAQGTCIILTTGEVRINGFPATNLTPTIGQSFGFLTFDMSWSIG